MGADWLTRASGLILPSSELNLACKFRFGVTDSGNRCCSEPVPTNACANCAAGGEAPAYWKLTNDDGLTDYVYSPPSSSSCIWTGICLPTSAQVDIVGSRFRVSSDGNGTCYSDTLPTDGSGKIINCNRTFALSGTGTWASMTPVSYGDSLYGANSITPAYSGWAAPKLDIDVTGLADNTYCYWCDNANGAYTLDPANSTNCNFWVDGPSMVPANAVCFESGVYTYHEFEVMFYRGSGTDKLYCKSRITYYQSSTEGPQLWCSTPYGSTDCGDCYNLDDATFPISMSFPANCYGFSSSYCNGTVNVAINGNPAGA